MGRLRVRNESNSAWIDICQSEWYIRNNANTGWMRLIPARGLRARHGTDNYWVDIDCLSEADCGDDPYGGTEDGKGENGSGPPGGAGGDSGNGDSGYPDGGGGDGGPTDWPESPGTPVDDGMDPITDWPDTGGMQPGNDSYTNPDLGSTPEGEGDGACDQGTFDGESYPPGYDLPDGCGPAAGIQTGNDGQACIYRPGLGVCEPYDDGGNSTSDNSGSSDDPSPCPVTVYGQGKTITETYVDLGTQSGEARIEYNIPRGSASIDVYYAGTRRATTNGRISGSGYLSFLFDAAEAQNNKAMVRVRQTDGTTWFITARCPDSVDDDDEGTITNPAPCHGTYEPKHGGGAGVHEMIHDFGSEPGQAVVEYQMWNIGDKMEVFYNGQLVATTGDFVSGTGSLTWNHQPSGGNTLVTIRVISSSDDTSWVYLINCPGEDGSDLNPKTCGDIDSTTKSGGAGVTDTYYDLGDEPGNVRVRYQMWNIPDRMDVYQGSTLVASTNGMVSGEGELTFDYKPHLGTKIRVRVEGDGKTTWAFLVECAQTNMACGETWSGSDARTVTTALEGSSGMFAYLEYATVGPAFGAPEGEPERIEVSFDGTVLDDTVQEELRWENGGYGGLPIPMSDSMDYVAVRAPNANSYWRQTVHCAIAHPTDGARFSRFSQGIRRAYPYGGHGAPLGGGAQMISPESDGQMKGESGAMAVNMFHTTTGKLRFRGQADDNATVWIAEDGGSLEQVTEFGLASVTHKDLDVAPGTYFVYVLQENIPDNTPGWVAMEIKERDTGKLVAITTRDWRMDYFESGRSYGNGNSAVMPEVEALMFDNDSQASNYMSQNAAPSMQQIFNTWPRTDGGTYYASGQSGGEAGDWYYDSGSDQFVMPTNTSLPNTILSLDELDSYRLAATLTSGSSDDDAIGLVLAARVVNGTAHILAVIRTQGGFPEPASGYGIIYYDGSATRVIADIGGGGTTGAWSGRASRVDVQRNGDSFSINATRFDGSALPQYNFSLNSDSALAKFKGPASFGFYTHSQPGSTYVDVSMPFAEGRVYSAASKKVWEAQSGSWVDVSSSKAASDFIQWPRVAVNPETGARYYVYRKAIRKV